MAARWPPCGPCRPYPDRVLGDIRRRSALTLAVSAVALAAACSSPKPLPPPPPIPVVTTVTPTTLPDYSTVSIAPVAGVTTIPAISLIHGQATLTGTVVDDTGAPVAGATVQLERIVGGAVAEGEVPTSADGSWLAPGVGGGIYRVRAWRAPDLSQTTATVVFVGATATETLTLTVNHFTGVQVQSSVAPSPPILGEPVEIAVEVTGSTVGTDGVVRSQGQGGVQLQLFGEGEWSIDGNATDLTSSSGLAGWEATCDGLGLQALSVLVNTTQAFPLSIPPCIPVPPTTTTSSTSTTVGSRGGPTTTRPRT